MVLGEKNNGGVGKREGRRGWWTRTEVRNRVCVGREESLGSAPKILPTEAVSGGFPLVFLGPT
jgi:hypothetical protein